MFDIFFTAESKKFLKKLSKEDAERIIASLERCKVRPHAFVKKLVGSPYFRLRVGKYRVILDIQSGTLVLLVIQIGHRKNIYD
ncbi:MAG: type II toxin-antitoxin system RelE family toxin [Candidatus Woesearchaeota archaeon]